MFLLSRRGHRGRGRVLEGEVPAQSSNKLRCAVGRRNVVGAVASKCPSPVVKPRRSHCASKRRSIIAQRGPLPFILPPKLDSFIFPSRSSKIARVTLFTPSRVGGREALGEDLEHLGSETNRDDRGAGRSRFASLFQDLGDLIVAQAGDDRSDVHAHRDAGVGEATHGFEAGFRRARVRSIVRAIASSLKGMLIVTPIRATRESSATKATSRRMSEPLVMIHAGLRNSRSTSRQRRVS